MISRINIPKGYNIWRNIHNFTDIWAVDSELSSGLTYGISDNKFAVIRFDGILFCPLHEIAELANMMRSDVRQEIMNVYKVWSDSR